MRSSPPARPSVTVASCCDGFEDPARPSRQGSAWSQPSALEISSWKAAVPEAVAVCQGPIGMEAASQRNRALIFSTISVVSFGSATSDPKAGFRI